MLSRGGKKQGLEKASLGRRSSLRGRVHALGQAWSYSY